MPNSELAANSLSELDDVAGQIARHEAAITALKSVRHEHVLALLAEGFSEREVARAAHLSGPRVHQIKVEEAARLAKYHEQMAATKEATRV